MAQCIIYFVAGFVGISMTFCFLFHELAVNVSIQERLYEEIQEINDELGGEPVTFETLQKMKYLDMVVSETLRKWPPGFMMDRQANKKYIMEDHDGTKALIRPNDVVWIPTFAIHRDPVSTPKISPNAHMLLYIFIYFTGILPKSGGFRP